jgi:hypothetical protein
MITVVHETSPIFVKTSEVPETKTRKAFIREFLKNKAYTSYSNLSCTSVQCRPGANRSVTEIHQLTLSRFPKTSFEAVLRIIKELIDEDASIRFTYCTTIKKVVIMYAKPKEGYSSPHAASNRELKGVDGYSIKDYEEVINNLN